MNTIIKTLSLALLVSMPVAYGMENNAIVSVGSEPIIINGFAIPDEILKEIFIYTLYDIPTSIHFKSACTYLYRLLDWKTIRQIIKPSNEEISMATINRYCEKYYDALNANLSYTYDEIADTLLKLKFTVHCLDNMKPAQEYFNQCIINNRVNTIKFLIENSIDPNCCDPHNQKALLEIASHEIDIFNLLLQHKWDIYQNFGDQIMDTALKNAEIGDHKMMYAIRQKKGDSHPHRQEHFDKFFELENKKNLALFLFLAAVAADLFCTVSGSTCTLF